jgi:hypothetical protein
MNAIHSRTVTPLAPLPCRDKVICHLHFKKIGYLQWENGSLVIIGIIAQ